jgi:hypothetical protein
MITSYQTSARAAATRVIPGLLRHQLAIQEQLHAARAAYTEYVLSFSLHL